MMHTAYLESHNLSYPTVKVLLQGSPINISPDKISPKRKKFKKLNSAKTKKGSPLINNVLICKNIVLIL